MTTQWAGATITWRLPRLAAETALSNLLLITTMKGIPKRMRLYHSLVLLCLVTAGCAVESTHQDGNVPDLANAITLYYGVPDGAATDYPVSGYHEATNSRGLS